MEKLDSVLLDPAATEDSELQLGTEKTTRDTILEYLGGYIVHKFRGGDCAACSTTLENSANNLNVTDLISIRTHGGLKRPSSRLMKLLKLAESHIKRHTDVNVRCSAYAEIIEDTLIDDDLPSATVGCSDHYVQKTAEILHFFLRCRLHFFSREKSKKWNEATRRPVPAGGGKK